MLSKKPHPFFLTDDIKLDGIPSKIRQHQQKDFVTLSGFWPLREWGGLSESVKKGKFVTKIFFR